MCGIAGIVGSAPDPAVIERMVDRLRHRGPDDRGVWRSDDAHLGHARLAILDLSAAGHQPMVRDQLVITYNGEVYNFRELRRRLPGPFRSDCDTEVVLAAYAEEGDRCLHRLRGMFAFAVWDARRHRLFAARDRLGIKPLFYRALPGGLAFASEIKALLELGRPPVDESALRDYLTYRYIPAPKTVFAGIRELPPGHTLVWQGGGALEVARWWEPSAEVTVTDMGEAVERLGRLLEIAVPMHTLADVPVGVFLSGGIDSTTIAAFVDRPRTFTLGSRIGHRDEAPVARRVAAHFGAEHHELLAESVDLDLALDTQPRLYDQPFGDSGSWATFLVSRLAREHVTVALCGEGGDELFCGYQWYRRWTEPPPPTVARALAGALPTFSALGRSLQRRVAAGLERYAAFLSPFTVEQKRALIGPRLEQEGYDDLWFFRRHWREELPPLKRLQWADLHTYLAGDLLARVDRASMAHSLELRPPLLDHELVELGLALDGPLLLDPATGTGKLVVRRLMAGRVPAGLFNRPKRGFNLPIRRWVARRPRLLSAALDRLAEAGIIRRPRALSFTGEQAWALLSLDRWVTSG
ncbi:MAG TPA: asparagine synthase (glutamine-hydrolyzing) [Thermoanaerobaculales bacterium]|nr:asparagine synthase (glutamine-hydrolyzing) [Thermoanaerobaculales bacterium]